MLRMKRGAAAELAAVCVMLCMLVPGASASEGQSPQAKAIPMNKLGAEVDQRYGAQGSGPVATAAGYKLTAKMQALEAEVSPAGLTVTSLAKKEGLGSFSIVPVALNGKELAATTKESIRTGADGSVVLNRGVVSERFTASSGGIRQDFIISAAPEPLASEFVLGLAVNNATLSASEKNPGSMVVTLDSGRRLAYSRLHVTDATGRELEARMDAPSTGGSELRIIVAAHDAQYPVTIDPTIIDEDWFALGTGMDREVKALAVDASGNLYAGGDFTTAGGVSANRIAKWDGTSWSALGSGMNATVYALVVDASGNLYAGGYFTTAGGVGNTTHIAKWNGSSWSALGSGMNSTVHALAFDTSGNLYAGGWFTTAGGVSANRIAKWNGSNWSALGSGMNKTVYALAVDSSDTLYVGGVFSAAGDVSSTESFVASWDGSSWSSLGLWHRGSDAPLMRIYVWALAVDSSGNLYAGGNSTVDSSNPCIAKWNGSSWSALGSGMDGDVNALAVDVLGNLYAGGSFTCAGCMYAGGSASRIAKWNGSNWSALGSGTNYTVNALAFDTSGNLYAGGDFTTAGDKFSPYIARCYTRECDNDSDCDDSLYCNGVEVCVVGSCVAGSSPCEGATPECAEDNDTCAECLQDSHCSDGVFCNGAEACVAGTCVPSNDPCAENAAQPFCDETNDRCMECLGKDDCPEGEVCNVSVGSCVACVSDADCPSGYCVGNECVECRTSANCTDGLYCNGAEICSGGTCVAATNPCSGATPVCDETGDRCVECLNDSHCSDGQFCNGAETCINEECVAGSSPCQAGELCRESSDQCVIVECASDADCASRTCYQGECTTECPDGNHSLCAADEACIGGWCLDYSYPACTYDSDCPSEYDYCFEGKCGWIVNADVCGEGWTRFPDGPCLPDGASCVPHLSRQCGRPADESYLLECLELECKKVCTYNSDCVNTSCVNGRCDGPSCTTNADCNNGMFCDGSEFCYYGYCYEGRWPCPAGEYFGCDETGDQCVECLNDSHCTDGQFCNGAETCINGVCGDGADPCSGGTPYCLEASDTCVECRNAADCDDGAYCNGAETCVAGACAAGTPPVCDDGVYCNGVETCNEATDSCNASTNPCSGATPVCDETGDRCVECLNDSQCDDFCVSNVCVECRNNTDCSDGQFCTGTETCSGGACAAGTNPCSGATPVCDETGDRCVECLNDSQCDYFCVSNVCVECRNNADCSDGQFCTGTETCSGGACAAGTNPCSGATPVCDETGDRCVECTSDSHCDPGYICTGNACIPRGSMQASSVKLKAGKTAGTDSMKLAGSLDATGADLSAAIGKTLTVTLEAAYIPAPGAITYTFQVPAASVNKGRYTSPKDTAASFSLDTTTGLMKFSAKNADLTGLKCPITFRVQFGDYAAQAQLSEAIVNGTKPCPLPLVMGVMDSLEALKVSGKKGAAPGADSVSISGTFTINGTVNPASPVVITLGPDTFTVPGAQFSESRGTYSCTGADSGNAYISAKFDTVKCTYSIQIKGADITGSGRVGFGINVFGNLLQSSGGVALPEGF